MLNLIYQGLSKVEKLSNWTLDEILVIAMVIMVYYYFRHIRK
tara:strand:+ start:266 stop:391 length:126 start_codon:yes stop_codon:yes gene_type:complete